MGENGPAGVRLAPASSHISPASSSTNAREKPVMMRRDGHEHEGESREGNDANYKAHRMAVLSVISMSQEGERALRTGLMWSTLSRRSSCNPSIQTGQKYLMFGDVAPDGKAFVTVCNLIRWESLTDTERQEIRRYKENGLRCR